MARMTAAAAASPRSLDVAGIVASGAPFQPTLDVGSSPTNVPNARLAAALAGHEFPITMAETFVSPVPWDEITAFLVGHTGEGVSFEARGRRSNAALASGDGFMIVVEVEYGDEWTITVAATDRALAEKWVAALAALLPGYPPPPPSPPLPNNVVPVSFWMQNPMTGGAYARQRNITVHEWGDVAPNYPGALAADLGALMALDTPSGGKLMTFHGPPGTGKTRAILTLISEWRDWCHASVVTDAEKFFGDAAYLNDLLFDSVGRRDWLLLVIEDGDEFMNVGSKDSKGQSIARILNVNDGIIGQGLNLLTLISTNVDVDQLNPAITRSGRCMANLHFGPFPPAEASAWALAHGVDADFEDDVSLADLYALVETSKA